MNSDLTARAFNSYLETGLFRNWIKGPAVSQLIVNVEDGSHLALNWYSGSGKLREMTAQDTNSGWYAENITGIKERYNCVLTIVEVDRPEYLERFRAYYRRHGSSFGGVLSYYYRFVYGELAVRNDGSMNPTNKGKVTTTEEFFDPEAFFDRIEKEYDVPTDALCQILKPAF